MTDLVSQLVGALEECLDDSRSVLADMEQKYGTNYRQDRLEFHRQVIAAAEAALTAAKAGGWLPIETAPKDGSLFLCWVQAVRYGETDEGQQYQQDASEVDFCRWCVCDESPNGGYFDNMAGQIADLQHVTAWQPLPNPPKDPS